MSLWRPKAELDTEDKAAQYKRYETMAEFVEEDSQLENGEASLKRLADLDHEGKAARLRAVQERLRTDPEFAERQRKIQDLFLIHDEVLVPATMAGLGAVVDWFRFTNSGKTTQIKAYEWAQALRESFSEVLWSDFERKTPVVCAVNEILNSLETPGEELPDRQIVRHLRFYRFAPLKVNGRATISGFGIGDKVIIEETSKTRALEKATLLGLTKENCFLDFVDVFDRPGINRSGDLMTYLAANENPDLVAYIHYFDGRVEAVRKAL
jgi:hypothetical protein